MLPALSAQLPAFVYATSGVVYSGSPAASSASFWPRSYFDTELSELFKDVFLFHWREESQHAILDELEWVRCDADLTAEQRERAVDEFIELVAAVDGILQAQAKADAAYFAATCGRPVGEAEVRAIEVAFLKAYRWQYIHSGAQHPQFSKVLMSLITEKQGQRIQAALATLQ
jgi:hypothetical protein